MSALATKVGTPTPYYLLGLVKQFYRQPFTIAKYVHFNLPLPLPSPLPLPPPSSFLSSLSMPSPPPSPSHLSFFPLQCSYDVDESESESRRGSEDDGSHQKNQSAISPHLQNLPFWDSKVDYKKKRREKCWCANTILSGEEMKRCSSKLWRRWRR